MDLNMCDGGATCSLSLIHQSNSRLLSRNCARVGEMVDCCSSPELYYIRTHCSDCLGSIGTRFNCLFPEMSSFAEAKIKPNAGSGGSRMERPVALIQLSERFSLDRLLHFGSE
jgi:hypothetical protein